MAIEINGLEEVVTNLNREIAKIEGRTEQGMRAVGLFIKAEAIPLTPLEFSPLRNSAFTDTQVDSSGRIRTRVGYTEPYAPYVHEMPPTNNFTTPGTGPKFLQRAIANNIQEILEILRARVSF